MTKNQKRIAKKNSRQFTITHQNGLTTHFSKVKKNGRRTVTTILD